MEYSVNPVKMLKPSLTKIVRTRPTTAEFIAEYGACNNLHTKTKAKFFYDIVSLSKRKMK